MSATFVIASNPAYKLAAAAAAATLFVAALPMTLPFPPSLELPLDGGVVRRRSAFCEELLEVDEMEETEDEPTLP